MAILSDTIIIIAVTSARIKINSRCLLYFPKISSYPLSETSHISCMPYLAAPALSLTFLENAWGGLAGHVSISGWLIILLLVRLVVALFTMTAAMLVSRAIGKKGNRALMPAVLAGVIVLVWILHQVTQLV